MKEPLKSLNFCCCCCSSSKKRGASISKADEESGYQEQREQPSIAEVAINTALNWASNRNSREQARFSGDHGNDGIEAAPPPSYDVVMKDKGDGMRDQTPAPVAARAQNREIGMNAVALRYLSPQGPVPSQGVPPDHPDRIETHTDAKQYPEEEDLTDAEEYIRSRGSVDTDTTDWNDGILTPPSVDGERPRRNIATDVRSMDTDTTDWDERVLTPPPAHHR